MGQTWDTSKLIAAAARARLFTHQAEVAGRDAQRQVIALLLHQGEHSQREIAKLVGVSKSEVNRVAQQPGLLETGHAPGADLAVYDLADTWIWGDPATGAAVRTQVRHLRLTGDAAEEGNDKP